MPRLTPFLIAILAVVAATSARADDAALWRALASGGHVALMRHATAPGVGDPPNFRLGDCATQRNLSEAGRAEARAIGERFRANGVKVGRVATSEWCRARDTATGMAIGPVIDEPRINSFFGEDRASTLQAVSASEAAVKEAPASGPITVFVSHQVNITALTGVYPASGEIVVAKVAGGTLQVVGTLKP